MPHSPPSPCGLSRGGTQAQRTNGLLSATCYKGISNEMLQPRCFKAAYFWLDFNLKKLAPGSWRRVWNITSSRRSFLRSKRRTFKSHLWANSQVNWSKDKTLFADSTSHQPLHATSRTRALLFTCGKWLHKVSKRQHRHSHPLHRFAEGSQTCLSWWRSPSAKGVLKQAQQETLSL